MVRTFSLFLALFLAGCSDQRKSEQERWQVQRLYQVAQEAAGEGRRREAEQSLRQLLALDTNHVGALCWLSRLLLEKGDGNAVAEALVVAERAVGVDAGSAIAWRELARAREASQQMDQAVAAWRKVVQLAPDNDRGIEELVSLLLRLGRSAEAEEELDGVLERRPDAWRIRLQLGKLLADQGKTQEAEKQWRAIPLTSPEAPQALAHLTALFARQGRFSDLRGDLEKLVSLNPQDAGAWTMLGAIDEREGRLSEAEANFRRALEIEKGEMRAWIGLARCLEKTSRREEARRALREADMRLGAEPELALELAEMVGLSGDRAWALSVLRRGKILLEEPGLLAEIEAALKNWEGKP